MRKRRMGSRAPIQKFIDHFQIRTNLMDANVTSPWKHNSSCSIIIYFCLLAVSIRLLACCHSSRLLVAAMMLLLSTTSVLLSCHYYTLPPSADRYEEGYSRIFHREQGRCGEMNIKNYHTFYITNAMNVCKFHPRATRIESV